VGLDREVSLVVVVVAELSHIVPLSLSTRWLTEVLVVVQLFCSKICLLSLLIILTLRDTFWRRFVRLTLVHKHYGEEEDLSIIGCPTQEQLVMMLNS
jgi:hypothetical protein